MRIFNRRRKATYQPKPLDRSTFKGFPSTEEQHKTKELMDSADKCPHCHKVMTYLDERCRYCGYERPKIELQHTISGETTNKLVCANCGYDEIVATDKKCWNCGKPIQPIIAKPQSQSKPVIQQKRIEHNICPRCGSNQVDVARKYCCKCGLIIKPQDIRHAQSYPPVKESQPKADWAPFNKWISKIFDRIVNVIGICILLVVIWVYLYKNGYVTLKSDIEKKSISLVQQILKDQCEISERDAKVTSVSLYSEGWFSNRYSGLATVVTNNGTANLAITVYTDSKDAFGQKEILCTIENFEMLKLLY